MQIKNKVAIVTGAGRGIGQAVSEAILKKEGKVVLSDIDSELGMKTFEEFKTKYGEDSVVYFKCDVVSERQQRELFKAAEEKFGRIDIVCNNAGVVAVDTPDNIDKVIDINLKGVIIGSMIAIEHMKKSGGGVIINTASAAGLEPLPLLNCYSASKWGVVGYMKSVLVEKSMSGSNIRINTVCPMFVRTKMGEFANGKPELEAVAEKYGVLEPSQVADGFIQLIENDAMNGVSLRMTEKSAFEFL